MGTIGSTAPRTVATARRAPLAFATSTRKPTATAPASTAGAQARTGITRLTAPTTARPPVAPAAAAAATGTGATDGVALLARAVEHLQKSATGRQVLDQMLQAGTKVRLQTREEFGRELRAQGEVGAASMAGASYDPKADQITIPLDSLVDPVKGAALLAHEAQHDFDALRGVKGLDSEVNAYLLQARVGGELGRPTGMAVRRDGSVVSDRAQLRKIIAGDALYR